MKITKLFLALFLVASLLSLDSCRSRASRNRNLAKKKTDQPVQTPTGGTSAQHVMSRADSVLAKVSAMSQEPMDIAPQVMPDDYPRNQSGYVPRPDLSAYSTYEAGLASFSGGDYDKAIGQFSQIVSTGRPSEMVPNAYYWMGESYYAMGRFADDIPYFEYTVQIGPQYKRESAMYKLARSNYAIGNTQAASMWYERLRTEYPKSSYSTKLKKLGVL